MTVPTHASNRRRARDVIVQYVAFRLVEDERAQSDNVWACEMSVSDDLGLYKRHKQAHIAKKSHTQTTKKKANG